MIMTQKYPWLLPLLLSPLGLIIPLSPRSGPLFVMLLGVAGNCALYPPPTIFSLAFNSTSLCDGRFSELFIFDKLLVHSTRAFFRAGLSTDLVNIIRPCRFQPSSVSDDTQKQRVTECLIPALIVGIVTGCIYGLLQYTGVYIRILTDFLGLSDELSIFYAENRLHIAKTMLLTNFAFFAILPWLWNEHKIEHF